MRPPSSLSNYLLPKTTKLKARTVQSFTVYFACCCQFSWLHCLLVRINCNWLDSLPYDMEYNLTTGTRRFGLVCFCPRSNISNYHHTSEKFTNNLRSGRITYIFLPIFKSKEARSTVNQAQPIAVAIYMKGSSSGRWSLK